MAYPQHNGYRPPVVGERESHLQVERIGFGDVGSFATLQKMREVVRDSLKDPRILDAGAALTEGARPRDQFQQAGMIRAWVQAHTRYLNDPPNLELIRTPSYLLDRIARDGVVAGDCDDMSVLTAALALAAGMSARFVAVGFQGARGPLVHVFTEVLTDRGWVEMDTTRPDGYAPPKAHRIETVGV